MFAQVVPPKFGEPQGSARAAGAPAFAEHVREQGSGQGTAEMVASFAPIKAVANEGSGRADRRRWNDADRREQIPTGVGELRECVVVGNRADLDEAVGQRHRDGTGEMVITRPGERHVGRHAARASDRRGSVAGELEHGFKESGNIGSGESVIAVAPLGFNGDESTIEQSCEVLTRGRDGDTRMAGEFGHGVRPLVEQGIEERDPSRVTEQTADCDNIACTHGMEVYGCTFRRVPKRWRRTLDNMSAPITLSTSEAVCAALHDPSLEPPPPPASIGHGATAALRAAMARFSSGTWHAERRTQVEMVLGALDPGSVRSAAFEIASRLIEVHEQVDAVADLAFRVPTEAMLAMLGVSGDHALLVDDVRAVAEVIGRGASANEASDAATERLLAACSRTDRNALAVVSVLYQTHDATAALFVETTLANHRHAHRAPAVNQTRRVVVTETLIDGIRLSPGSIVVLDLATAGLEFGAGPHQCPGRSVAEAIVDGIVAAIDPARCVLRDISASVTDDGRPTSILTGPSGAPGSPTYTKRGRSCWSTFTTPAAP
jgi:hypothetical protein